MQYDLEGELERRAEYDYPRTIRAVIYGGLVFAPIGNKLYKFMDTIKFPLSWQPKRLYDTMARVSFDQLVWAPVGIPLYYTSITFMEGYGIPEIKAKLREVYLDTLINNWKVWPLFQAFNFWFTPVRYRLLAVNIISIVWNCYLSIKNQLSNAKVEHSED
ncbi:hypothetical protein KL912_005003 [Ogataea haglerorum]|nr:hypothetical protein KL912_005003 [Ogataea haglerorum]